MRKVEDCGGKDRSRQQHKVKILHIQVSTRHAKGGPKIKCHHSIKSKLLWAAIFANSCPIVQHVLLQPNKTERLAKLFKIPPKQANKTIESIHKMLVQDRR